MVLMPDAEELKMWVKKARRLMGGHCEDWAKPIFGLTGDELKKSAKLALA